MLLTIRCTGPEAEDLSWLLHKRPERLQVFEFSYGKAYVFFSEYSKEVCAASLLLDIEEKGLNELYKAKDGDFQYVNPRQYLTSSLLTGAMAKVFSSALNGICKERPELLQKTYDFEIEITNLSCRFNPLWLEKIFMPLGYQLELQDPASNFIDLQNNGYNLKLSINNTLAKILSQLFILLPVLDRHTHFWINESQWEKFLRHGEGWLKDHPEKRLIIREYFGSATELKHQALEHFEAYSKEDKKEDKEGKVKLSSLREAAILDVLNRHPIQTVIDLGCGEGKLLTLLYEQNKYTKVAGMDISPKSLMIARKKLERVTQHVGEGENLFIGSLICRDERISGYDAMILSEVIEHFEPERMELVMQNILGEGAPKLCLITTPDRDYNTEYEFLQPGNMRHHDHRYEFNKSEFASFCQKYALAFGYEFEIIPVGQSSAQGITPTLLGVFKKCA